MSVKKFSFNIFNEKYQIVIDNCEETVLKAVSRVDSLMRDISSKLDNKEKSKVAVLAALQLAEKIVGMEELLEFEDKEAANLASKIDRELSL